MLSNLLWIWFTISLSTLFLLTGAAPPETQTSYYVDPVRGSDENSGTSLHAPFKTINKARDVIRNINKNMTGDIYVYLRGGNYWLTSTLNFTNEDSGTNGYNIIYAAYKNEKPLFNGGRLITGWSLYDTSHNIYRAYAGGKLETRQLFVNGIRATRARSTSLPAPLTFAKGFGYTATGNVFANSSIPMHNWHNQDDIEFVYKCEWTAPRICVRSITYDGNTTTITMKQPGWGFVTNKGGTSVGGIHNSDGMPWYIENAFELLDEEGEWYLDRTIDSFYYKPRMGENITTSIVIAPVLEELLRIQGADSSKKASNIQFKGISFCYATFLRVSGDRGLPDAQNNVIRDNGEESIITAAVSLKDAQNIRFERLRFEHLGGSGINMYRGSQNNLTMGTVFTDISGNGIQVGDYTGLYKRGTDNYGLNSDTLVWLKNNDVINCYFYHIGVEYFASTAIAASLPQDMDILHNEISGVPYSGIHVGWGWNLFPNSIHSKTNIQYNYVHDVMSVLRDGGAIYTLGPTNGSSVNKGYISNNYIQNVLNQFGGLYTDEGSSWYDLNNNVVNNSPKYAHIWTNSIHDIHVNNTYSTTSNFTNKGTNTTITNTTIITNGNWPTAAKTIIDSAGLQKPFQDIKKANRF